MLTTVLLAASMVVVVGQADVEVPEEIRSEIGFMAGRWESDVTHGEEEFKAKSHRKWGRGKYCLVEQWNSDDFAGVGVFGWDPASNELVETWYCANGQRIENRYKVVSDKVWEGTSKLHFADGTIEDSTIRLEKTSPDSFTFVGTTGDAKFIEYSRRVKKEEQEKDDDDD